MARASAYLQHSAHSVFYFRIRVPEAARSAIPCTHIRRSLRTKYRREAVVRCAALLEQVEDLFLAAERGDTVNVKSLTWSSTEHAQHRPSVAPGPAPAPAPAPEPKPAPSPEPEPTTDPVQVLSSVWEEFEQLQRLEGIGDKTISNKAAVVALLTRVVGDIPIDQFRRKHAKQFKEIALKLPSRALQLTDQPLSGLIETATKTITIGTYNNYIKHLGTLFSFAVREGYCSTNPFDGLKIKQRVKKSLLRARFSEEDLSRLFSPTRYAAKDNRLPYRYWMPYLGLYTGARLNELCQLYLDDFVTVNGIDCIHIRAERPDQRLKSLSSERLIPIHSKLKELGLLEYVQQQKDKGHDRLFSELQWSEHHGYAKAPSNWFSRYRDALGLKGGKERKDFHSFRHTVADTLKQLGMSENLVGGLLGHTTGGITFNRYGKDWKPEVMTEVVEALEWFQ